jgi:hypothetical protein
VNQSGGCDRHNQKNAILRVLGHIHEQTSMNDPV